MYTTVVGVLEGDTVNSVSRKFELNFPEPSQFPTSEGFEFPTSSGEEPKQQTAGGQTTQSAGEETAQGTGEETTQPPEGAGRQAIKQVTIETTDEGGVQRIYMTGGQAVNHETIVTTDEGGVDQITITGNRVGVTQQVASAPSRPSKEPQEKVTSNQDERQQRRVGGIEEACASIVSLHGSFDPELVLIGAQVTFTLEFVNTSGDETVQDLTLRNILPEGMKFVSASNDGVEFGNVITWRLGGLQPGEQGTRSFVAQANFPPTGGTFLTKNNAYTESPGEHCARTRHDITIQPVSLGDDDNDGFSNGDEVRCGSDPKDAASSCYSLELLEEDKVVERGSELTFTVLLRRNFNFEGEVTFNTSNNIPGVLWTFSRLSAVLNQTDGMVSFPFTIKTTTTTPLGEHKIIIEATSGDMKMEKTLILKVEPSRKSSVPTEGLTPVSPS
jgi:uncharacterized repeat protein (TIGR01451 family)